ncbi:hypothetical protein ABL78_6230 [Leptomonas seymouri]|uniref:Uncharacterized protein n=1 Tax=Leptomonas seymouri TaxID=5684 RepID=A0A0N1PD13_LEPSE|nr:hypothetical protein ABL78_6230 [Leptomonas seymouri]|eukprot:KPI84708.1 hypothetical protein ABL78_6230 [Leptomonas seymouri]
MSCKCFYRLLVCVLITGLTICTLISMLEPLFTRTIPNGGGTTVLTLSFVSIDNKTITAAGPPVNTRTNTRDLECSRAKVFYVASCVLVIISVILGGVNVLCALVWIMAPCGFLMGSAVLVLTFAAFACSLIPFVLVGYSITHPLCPDALSSALVTSEDNPMRVLPGYILLFVSFMGLFATFLLEVLGCFCGCQLERSKDFGFQRPAAEDFDNIGVDGGRSPDEAFEMQSFPLKK